MGKRRLLSLCLFPLLRLLCAQHAVSMTLQCLEGCALQLSLHSTLCDTRVVISLTPGTALLPIHGCVLA